MPTPRFTVVSPPLEQQIATSAAKGWNTMFHSVRSANISADGRVAASAVQQTLRPGGAAFVLVCLIVCLIGVRSLIIRIETRRILKAHAIGTEGPRAGEGGAPDNGEKVHCE